MATRATWDQAPILVLPFTAPSLTADSGGSPFMMELLALSGALQLLAHLQLQGTVYSDCQGLIRKLQQRNVLRRNTTSTGFPLLRDCKRLMSGTRAIQWIKGHPERSQARPQPPHAIRDLWDSRLGEDHG